MESFRDRVALITGAASGIGRQLALRLAEEGARIAALDRQGDALDRLAGELKGKVVDCAVADVTDLAAVRAAVTQLETRVGPTDLLVASAGIGMETPAETFRAEDFTAQIQVNLIGVINTLDAVLPGMCQRQSGHVAALSSLASYRGLPNMGGYCASKAGLNSLFDALRIELAPKGIAVTTICPAWVRTPLTTPLGLPDKELMDLEDAVRRILRALHARKPFLAFPAGSAWQARLLLLYAALDQRLADPTVGSQNEKNEAVMEPLFHYVAPPTCCGYLPQQKWSLEYEYVAEMTSAEYLQRMLDNWRRFGHMLFRPACQACSSCRSLRVAVPRFRPDRSQCRCRQTNEGVIELRIGEPRVTRAKLALYDRYHAFQSDNKGWPNHAPRDTSSYAESFVNQPFPVEEWCYYLDGQLIGVGYVDVLTQSVEGVEEEAGGFSAIYFFYDPRQRQRSLGTWNVLSLIDEAAKRGLPYVYLGYFVEGCRSMSYKACFRPNQLRGADGVWSDYRE